MKMLMLPELLEHMTYVMMNESVDPTFPSLDFDILYLSPVIAKKNGLA